MATSALAVVISRPGTRLRPGRGENRSGSTPTGTTCRRSIGTRWSRQTSAREDSDTVTTRSRRRATRVCIRVKAYQRRLPNRSPKVRAWASSRRRSTVMGWWTVASTGQPPRCRASTPQPRHWLSWTTSKSARRVRRWRQARRLKARGSLKLPVANEACSTASVQSFHSHSRGLRMGWGSAHMSRLGSSVASTDGSRTGWGGPLITVTVWPSAARALDRWWT